jgi:hypothetical protein
MNNKLKILIVWLFIFSGCVTSQKSVIITIYPKVKKPINMNTIIFMGFPDDYSLSWNKYQY